MSLKGVKRVGYVWWKQKKEGVPVSKISVSRNRKKCGRPTILTTVIARRMIAIQAESHGKLSYRRLCGKMKLEGMVFGSNTVQTWCNALGIKKYKKNPSISGRSGRCAKSFVNLTKVFQVL